MWGEFRKRFHQRLCTKFAIQIDMYDLFLKIEGIEINKLNNWKMKFCRFWNIFSPFRQEKRKNSEGKTVPSLAESSSPPLLSTWPTTTTARRVSSILRLQFQLLRNRNRPNNSKTMYDLRITTIDTDPVDLVKLRLLSTQTQDPAVAILITDTVILVFLRNLEKKRFYQMIILSILLLDINFVKAWTNMAF